MSKGRTTQITLRATCVFFLTKPQNGCQGSPVKKDVRGVLLEGNSSSFSSLCSCLHMTRGVYQRVPDSVLPLPSSSQNLQNSWQRRTCGRQPFFPPMPSLDSRNVLSLPSFSPSTSGRYVPLCRAVPCFLSLQES